MFRSNKYDTSQPFVKADIEHLQKLFIMPDSPDKFIEFGTELLDLIHDSFKSKGGIHSEISLPQLAKLFNDISIPKEPHLLKDVLAEIKNKIVAHSVKVGNPYYIGHMTSAIPYFMILLEMIIASLNQNQVKIETAKASTFVEREFITWIHKLIYEKEDKYYKTNIHNKDVSLGNVTFDGTMANLTALLVARNKAFPANKDFPGIREAGIVEAYRYYNIKKSVIIVSKRGHYSVDKIARIIGIGSQNIIKIPVNSKNKMDINELKKTVFDIEQQNRTNKEKIKIIAIIGIAGTTETGNIDNLNEIRKVAKHTNTHFHVDAAWGGGVLLVNQFKYLFKGIRGADSVTIDAHKLLYTPMSMGMVLFNNERDLTHLKHSSNYIIRTDSVDLGRFTIEGSRPFSVLKPWATLKILGSDGFRMLFEHAFELTSVLRGIVEIHCNFEAINQPELFIFVYRFVPKKIKEKIENIMMEIEAKKILGKKGFNNNQLKLIKRIEQINELLNELNIELHRAIREEDNSFVSRTMIEVQQYFNQNIVVQRAVTVNPLTTAEILKEIIDDQNKLGVSIFKADFYHKFEKI